jgi:RNA polymerase sigma factor (sigma-70 family)
MQAEDEDAAREALGDALAHHASPLIRRIAARQLGSQLGSMVDTPGADPDLDDIHATVLLRLTAQCWQLRRDRTAPAIASLSSYAATATYNTCHEWLRARAPRRTRLQNRVRYVLTRDPMLALWEVADREWWCGLRASQQQARQLQQVQQVQPPEGVLRKVQDLAGITKPLRDANPHSLLLLLIRQTLTELGGPCRFRDLVAALAEVLGETDAAGGPTATRPGDGVDPTDIRDVVEQLEDRGASPAEALEHRDYLQRLWSELVQLPLRQRAALLLNLRDEQGGGMLALFPITGVASTRDIARALDISDEALAELWSTLPRDDQWIAEYLGITRRQVINLRKCARERLARRMRARESMAPAREPATSRPI